MMDYLISTGQSTTTNWPYEETAYIPLPELNLKATKIHENAIKARTTLKQLIYSPYSGAFIRQTIFILKSLFSKSGHLNKRIRAIRKNK